MSAMWIVSLLFGVVALTNAQTELCTMGVNQFVKYVPAPASCNSFVLCYRLGLVGEIRAHKFDCAYGLYYDGNDCDYIDKVECAFDACASGVRGYRHPGHPRSYFSCSNRRAVRQRCCPQTEVYDNTLDMCVTDTGSSSGDDIYCNDLGVVEEQTLPPCDKTVDANDRRRYSGPVNDLTYKFRCPSGTFVEETCSCSGPAFNGPCEPTLAVNFANGVVENDPNGITVHIRNDGGVISNGRASFNGQGGLSSQYFIGAYYGRRLRISITFTESPQGAFGDQTLVSQSSIDGDERSIVISVNRQTSQVTFALGAETFSSVAVSFNGAQNQRKTAILDYDGENLVGRVTWPGGDNTNSVKLSGVVLGRSDPLRFASGVNLPSFTGSIEDIQLFQFCSP